MGPRANIGSTACQAAAKSLAATALQTLAPPLAFFVMGIGANRGHGKMLNRYSLTLRVGTAEPEIPLAQLRVEDGEQNFQRHAASGIWKLPTLTM